jgi:hypothetical protein
MSTHYWSGLRKAFDYYDLPLASFWWKRADAYFYNILPLHIEGREASVPAICHPPLHLTLPSVPMNMALSTILWITKLANKLGYSEEFIMADCKNTKY